MRILVLLSLLAFAVGCNDTQKKADTAEKRVVVNDTIPRERTNVNPKPVATYSAPVPDALNQFKFAVKLYETPLRFRYRVAVTYKMMDVKESIDIPNFGYQPKVDVQKYENDLSCMIGFYDAAGTFMDLKKIEIVDNQQSIHTMASSQYYIRNQEGAYFLTMTVVDWVDVFTRPTYRHIMVESLQYCQLNKGLRLYAWCLMSNHLHLIAAADDGINLSDILRDMKKFSSKRIVKEIQEQPESRRDWMLSRFAYAGKFEANVKEYKFWQDGNQAKEGHSPAFLLEKLNYIHHNPVRNQIVEEAEHYLFSSARNYAGMQGLIEVIVL